MKKEKDAQAGSCFTPPGSTFLTDEVEHPDGVGKGRIVQLRRSEHEFRFAPSIWRITFIRTVDGRKFDAPREWLISGLGLKISPEDERIERGLRYSNLLWIESLANGKERPQYMSAAKQHMEVWNRYVKGRISFEDAKAAIRRLPELPPEIVY